MTIISYVTLDQIHEVNAGMLDPQSFIEKMPLVIAFLLSLAVLAAVALSVFVAKSVSEPLRELRSVYGSDPKWRSGREHTCGLQ